ncbi:MAG: FeoA family protein [Anaerolineales bacterium]
MKHDQTMPLDQMWEGAIVELVDVHANHKFGQRLADLGLLPHTRVVVLSCIHGQPLIIRVRGSKIAVDRRTAHRILARPVCGRPESKRGRRAWRNRRGRRLRGKRFHRGSRARWVDILLNVLQTMPDEDDTEQ